MIEDVNSIPHILASFSVSCLLSAVLPSCSNWITLSNKGAARRSSHFCSWSSERENISPGSSQNSGKASFLEVLKKTLLHLIYQIWAKFWLHLAPWIKVIILKTPSKFTVVWPCLLLQLHLLLLSAVRRCPLTQAGSCSFAWIFRALCCLGAFK